MCSQSFLTHINLSYLHSLLGQTFLSLSILQMERLRFNEVGKAHSDSKSQSWVSKRGFQPKIQEGKKEKLSRPSEGTQGLGSQHRLGFRRGGTSS